MIVKKKRNKVLSSRTMRNSRRVMANANEEEYTVIGYLNKRYYGVVDSETVIGRSQAESLVWEYLNKGEYVEMIGNDEEYRFSPDLLDEYVDFDSIYDFAIDW